MGYFQEMMMKRLEDIQERAQQVADNVAKEVGKEADQYALRMIIPEAEYELRSAFRNATAAWYNAYSPKKYSRSFSLFDAMNIDTGGNMSIGWLYKEDMSKPSWGGGSFNIYGLVFEGGSHGGPVHGRAPVKSTPIPVLFEREMPRIHDRLQRSINDYGQRYFAENFNTRFQQRFQP